MGQVRCLPAHTATLPCRSARRCHPEGNRDAASVGPQHPPCNRRRGASPPARAARTHGRLSKTQLPQRPTMQRWLAAGPVFQADASLQRPTRRSSAYKALACAWMYQAGCRCACAEAPLRSSSPALNSCSSRRNHKQRTQPELRPYTQPAPGIWLHLCNVLPNVCTGFGLAPSSWMRVSGRGFLLPACQALKGKLGRPLASSQKHSKQAVSYTPLQPCG